MTRRATLAAFLLGMLALTGCADPAPAPPPRPATVASVETAQAITIAVGADRYRVYNTVFEVAGSEPGSCEARSDTAVARRMLVGRTVADAEFFKRWDDPTVPAGYAPGKLRFAVPDREAGDDLMSEFSRAAAEARAIACPPERASVTDREVPDSGDDTYVQLEGDDGGESRVCSRKWWC